VRRLGKGMSGCEGPRGEGLRRRLRWAEGLTRLGAARTAALRVPPEILLRECVMRVGIWLGKKPNSRSPSPKSPSPKNPNPNTGSSSRYPKLIRVVRVLGHGTRNTQFTRKIGQPISPNKLQPSPPPTPSVQA